RDDLADHAQRFRLLGPEDLLSEHECAAPDRADDFRPERMNAVARYDAEGEVRLVLEHRVRRRNHDIRKEHIFGVDRRRSVERGDHRYGNVEQICQDLFALAINLVVTTRREEVEALGIDAIDESLARSREDDHSIARVLADLVEQFDELFVRVAVEDQRGAVRVEDDLEHAVLRAWQSGVWKQILVRVDTTHRFAPFNCSG